MGDDRRQLDFFIVHAYCLWRGGKVLQLLFSEVYACTSPDSIFPPRGGLKDSGEAGAGRGRVWAFN